MPLGQSDTTREAIHAIRKAHEWLERVEQMPGGYFGLDHKLGENDNGCTFCHAVAALEGRALGKTRAVRVEMLPREPMRGTR